MIFTPRPLSDPEATDVRMALSRIGQMPGPEGDPVRRAAVDAVMRKFGQMPPCPQGDPVAAAVAARIDSLLR